MQQYIIYSKDLFHDIFSSFTNATVQYRVSTSITNKKMIEVIEDDRSTLKNK